MGTLSVIRLNNLFIIIETNSTFIYKVQVGLLL